MPVPPAAPGVPTFIWGAHDPLEDAIRAGDKAAALDALKPLTPAARRDRREGLLEMGMQMQRSHWVGKFQDLSWGGQATAAQHSARDAALMVCGQPADLLEEAIVRQVLHAQEWADVCHTFSIDMAAWRAQLQKAAEAALDRPERIVEVQRLVAAGLIDRPQGDRYSIGLIALPRASHWLSDTALQTLFQQDPALHEAALSLFEVEGTSEHNLAAVDQYSRQDDPTWSEIFLRGIDTGAYTREQLLDKALGTLAQDWPQFRAGWFSRFHKQLAPRPDEMTPRAGQYLALCQSRIPPTVTLALASLKVLLQAGAVGGESLLEALSAVLTSSVKAQVDTALKLIDTVVQRQPSLALPASAACVVGLVHESAEVQGKVLQRLAHWGLDEATRERLADHAGGIAAVHRTAFDGLVGRPPNAPPDTSDTATALPAPALQRTGHTQAPGAVGPLDLGRALAPLDNLDELLDRCAFVLENAQALDEFERVVEALVRLAPFAPEAAKRFAVVLKRARRFKHDHGPAYELSRLLRKVLAGEQVASWVQEARKQWPPSQRGQLDAEAYLALRIDDCMALAARGEGLSPLDAATHRRGFIAPQLLVQRIATYHAQRVVPAPLAQVQALLRLPAGTHAAEHAQALAAAQALPDTPLTRALRHALGDDAPVKVPSSAKGSPAFQLERDLFCAAARIRCPGRDDPAVLAAFGDAGPDTGAVARYQWTVHTTHHETEGKRYTYQHFTVRAQDAGPVAATPLLLARHRIPSAGPKDQDWVFWRFAGGTVAQVGYAASLMPGNLDTHFAGAANEIAINLRWNEAHWEHSAYLQLLLDPTVPVAGMACLTLAVALGTKEPGQAMLAVDALLQSHAEGRLDTAALGAALRDLAATPLPLLARYAKSLRSALRIEPQAAPLLFSLLCDMLCARGDTPPKDLALLMELLLELSLTLRRPLPAATHEALCHWQLSGKARTARQTLLEQVF